MPPNSYAVVLGGADGVWDDLKAVTDLLGEPSMTIAVNDAGEHYTGRLDAFATQHPEKLPGWLCRRAVRGLPPPDRVYSHRCLPLVSHIVPRLWTEIPGNRRSGDSGLYAVRVAWVMGARRIVLCGVPLNAVPHFFGWEAWRHAKHYREVWGYVMPRLRGSVRSMSGWTAQRLGKPTKRWATAK